MTFKKINDIIIKYNSYFYIKMKINLYKVISRYISIEYVAFDSETMGLNKER